MRPGRQEGGAAIAATIWHSELHAISETRQREGTFQETYEKVHQHLVT